MTEPSRIQTPVEYFRQILEPDYNDFQAKPTNLRLAFHAAGSLFQLRDWVARELSLKRGELQNQLEQRCKYFALIRDVANASKHLKLSEPSTTVTGAGDVQLREIGVGGYNVGPGGYGHGLAYGLVPAIIVVPDMVVFGQAADEVFKMWKEYFREKEWNSA